MKTLAFLLLIANILFYAWLNHWLLWLPWQPAQITPIAATHVQASDPRILLVQEQEQQSSTPVISKLADPHNLLGNSDASPAPQENSDLSGKALIASADDISNDTSDTSADLTDEPSQAETTAEQSDVEQSEEQTPEAATEDTEIIMVNEEDLPAEESNAAQTEAAIQQQGESKHLASANSPIKNFLPARQAEKPTPDQGMNASQQTQAHSQQPQQNDAPTQEAQAKTSQAETEESPDSPVDNAANTTANQTYTTQAHNQAPAHTMSPMGAEMANNPSSTQTPPDATDQNQYLCFKNGPFSQKAAVQKRAKWWQQQNTEVNIQTQPFKTQVTRVYIPPLPTRQQAEQMVQRLRNQKITDTEISTQSELRHAIFVGTYRNPLYVDRRILELRGKGYNDIRTQSYLKDDTKYWLNVKMPATQAELLKHYREQFPAVSVTSTTARCAANKNF